MHDVCQDLLWVVKSLKVPLSCYWLHQGFHTLELPLYKVIRLTKCNVKLSSTPTLRRRHSGQTVCGMDPYWGSLHCVCTLSASPRLRRATAPGEEVQQMQSQCTLLIVFFTLIRAQCIGAF